MTRILLLMPTTTYRAGAFMAAAHRLDLDVVVASERRSVFEEAQPDRLMTLDFRDDAGAARHVADFAARRRLDAVVGVDDATAVLAASLAESLALPHNPLAAVRAAREKHLMRKALSSAGVPIPSFALRSLEDDAAKEAGRTLYPCVGKPLVLSASRGVMRADGPRQFVGAVRRLGRILEAPEVAANGDAARHFLVESFVPGREVALEGLLVRGRLHVLALFDKPDPLDGPFFEESIYVTPSRRSASIQEEISECTARAAAALGLCDGPVHAELRVNGGGPKVIELAARPIGGL